MHFAGLLAGVLLIYVLPGAAMVWCLLGSLRRYWPAVPLFSIIGVGLIYSVLGLVLTLPLTPVLSTAIAFGIALFCGVLGLVRKSSPLMTLSAAVSLRPAWTGRAMTILVVANVALVSSTHLSNLIGRMPNVADTIGRVNMVLMLRDTGIPPRHWLQPTADLIYYFYTYVPAAALSQFGGNAISIPVVWWVHVTLQALGYSAVAVYVFFNLGRSAKLSVWATVFFFFGSTFGLVSNLISKSGHLPGVLKHWADYSTAMQMRNAFEQAMWVPQHVLILVVALMLPVLHWRASAHAAVKVVLAGLLLAFMAGGSTFLFAAFCAGLAAWLVVSLIQRQWEEWTFWGGACVVAAPLIWPFYRYISGHNAGGGLRLAPYPLELFSAHGMNQLAGLGLEILFLVLQFGCVSIGLWLVWRKWRAGWRPDGETAFLLVSGTAMIVFLLAITSSVGPGDMNNLGVRGLLIPSSFFLLAVLGVLKGDVLPTSGWKWGVLGALAIYSLAPAAYSYAGSMNLLRRVPTIPPIVRWANQSLPADAVVVVDEAVLNDQSMTYYETYGRCRWSWIERQKWVSRSAMTHAERSTVDLSAAAVFYPTAYLTGRPSYLFRFRQTPAGSGATTVYEDEQFGLDRLP